jgi:hypothetical protein
MKTAGNGTQPSRATPEGVMDKKRKWQLVILGFAVLTILAGFFLCTAIVPGVGAMNALAPSTEAGWHLGTGVTYENLTIFPVLSASEADTTAFATLDEALASGDAVVTEQGNYLRRSRDGATRPGIASGPQVNQLVLVNRGKKPLLLLAGEVVSGGKQDRIIGKDRLVPAGAEPLPLDVFCVEQGRWTGGSDRFAAAKMMVHPSVREKAAFEQDQSKVWAAVRGESASTSASAPASGVGTPSTGGRAAPAAAPQISAQSLSTVIVESAPTGSYGKIYNSTAVGPSVESFSRKIQARFRRATTGLKGQHVVGVVVAYGGEVAWGDIFASSELFDAYWPKLLRSYVVEALTRPASQEKVSLEDARDFLTPSSGHTREEIEPGVYRWSERTAEHISEIELEALEPKPLTLHWVKVARP